MANISNRYSLKIIVAFTLFLSAGCGAIGVVVDGGGRGPRPAPAPAPAPAPRSYPSYHSLKIPPGHLPPPGQCKVWYPGKPPGHQPPPVSCESALRSAGMDAWVLYRPSNDPKLLEVKERKQNQGKMEVVIRHYLID